jgi:hypothetical protein
VSARALYFLILVVAAISCVLSDEATAATSEHEVKAAFMYNFSRFVQWPGPETDKPFTIGVIGKDPFGPVLDEAVQGKRVNGRELVVRRFSRIESVVGCNILFVASSEENNLERILHALRGMPVLTIGEMNQFGERGGMINLITQGNRIRFEINVEAIERGGLKVSSDLLRLAKIVTESQPVK